METAELPPEQVIAWLRSEDGDAWRKVRTGMIYRHGPYAGVFGEVCLPPGPAAGCRWPDPFPADTIHA